MPIWAADQNMLHASYALESRACASGYQANLVSPLDSFHSMDGQTCRRDHAGDEEHSPHGLGHAHRPEVLAHGDGRGRRAATGQAVREAGVRASREAQGRAWRAWGCAPREEAMFVVHSALLYVACGTGSWYIVDQ